MGILRKIVDMFSAGNEDAPMRNLGRNEICWCGSGKKYKKCHLQEDESRQYKKNALNCGKT